MLEYVKPEKRWQYLQRVLNKQEIDIEAVALDQSIVLTTKFYENNWRGMKFYIFIASLCMQLAPHEARDFIARVVPKIKLAEDIKIFLDLECLKSIRGLDLNGVLKLYHIANVKHDSFIGFKQLAELVNNGNIDGIETTKYLIDNYNLIDNSFENLGVIDFFKEIKNKKYFKIALSSPFADESAANRKLLEKLYYERFRNIDANLVKANKLLKGKLWLMNTWRGLKNTVRKKLKI